MPLLSAADNAGQNGNKRCGCGCLKENLGKTKASTLMSRQGSLQMDTLNAVKSKRRQQPAAGGEMHASPKASFWLKGCQAEVTCSRHNPLATNGLTEEGMSDHSYFIPFACVLGSSKQAISPNLQKLERMLL